VLMMRSRLEGGKGGRRRSTQGQIFSVASVNAEIDRENELGKEVPPFPSEKGGSIDIRWRCDEAERMRTGRRMTPRYRMR